MFYIVKLSEANRQVIARALFESMQSSDNDGEYEEMNLLFSCFANPEEFVGCVSDGLKPNVLNDLSIL